jgi:serine/threonine protein kinase
MPRSIGRYTLERELGRGASASVYLAHDGFKGRQVAIKLFWHGHSRLSGPHRSQFLNEAALVGRLHHPHIVDLLDAAVERDFSYVVMEYVPGGTLEAHVTPATLLPLEKAIEVAYKVSRALEYAHRHGVIHRDIKPANILFTPKSDVKLSDFGVALLEHATHTSLHMAGSPAYASPEQLEGRPLGMQTDMWSLAVVLYQMLAGRLPFVAGSFSSLMYQIANIAPPSLKMLRTDLPDAITQLVERALQKDARMRHSGWDAFSGDLSEVVHRMEVPPPDHVSEARQFEALRGLSFFRQFREVEIWETLRAGTWRALTAGTTLIREGERGQCLYVLVDGQVEVTRAGYELAKLVNGACFGELLYFEDVNALRGTTARACTDVVVLEIRTAALTAASDACQVQFNRAFLRILLARLEEANRRIAGC